MSLTYKQLLVGNRDFRNLFAGQVVSELGNWFNFIAALGLVRVVSNAAPDAATIILMSVGAALGGSAAAIFGYEIAFVINAASFVASAISIWLIPDRAMYDEQSQILLEQNQQTSVFADIKDGWTFIKSEPLVLTIILMNTIWAIGGGALNLVAERLGGVVFAGENGLSADAAVAWLYAAAGAGLFIGMMIARKTDLFVRDHRLLVPFIGWMLVLQGVLYAVAGLMPNLWLAAILMCISRILLGVEYAIQETILIRAIPDRLRGRVMTTDRAVELSVFTASAGFAGWSLYFITPQMLAVWSGLLSSAAGFFWFAQIRRGRPSAVTVNAKPPDEPAVLTAS